MCGFFAEVTLMSKRLQSVVACSSFDHLF